MIELMMKDFVLYSEAVDFIENVQQESLSFRLCTDTVLSSE